MSKTKGILYSLALVQAILHTAYAGAGFDQFSSASDMSERDEFTYQNQQQVLPLEESSSVQQMSPKEEFHLYQELRKDAPFMSILTDAGISPTDINAVLAGYHLIKDKIPLQDLSTENVQENVYAYSLMSQVSNIMDKEELEEILQHPLQSVDSPSINDQDEETIIEGDLHNQKPIKEVFHSLVESLYKHAEEFFSSEKMDKISILSPSLEDSLHLQYQKLQELLTIYNYTKYFIHNLRDSLAEPSFSLDTLSREEQIQVLENHIHMMEKDYMENNPSSTLLPHIYELMKETRDTLLTPYKKEEYYNIEEYIQRNMKWLEASLEEEEFQDDEDSLPREEKRRGHDKDAYSVSRMDDGTDEDDSSNSNRYYSQSYTSSSYSSSPSSFNHTDHTRGLDHESRQLSTLQPFMTTSPRISSAALSPSLEEEVEDFSSPLLSSSSSHSTAEEPMLRQKDEAANFINNCLEITTLVGRQSKDILNKKNENQLKNLVAEALKYTTTDTQLATLSNITQIIFDHENLEKNNSEIRRLTMEIDKYENNASDADPHLHISKAKEKLELLKKETPTLAQKVEEDLADLDKIIAFLKNHQTTINTWDSLSDVVDYLKEINYIAQDDKQFSTYESLENAIGLSSLDIAGSSISNGSLKRTKERLTTLKKDHESLKNKGMIYGENVSSPQKVLSQRLDEIRVSFQKEADMIITEACKRLIDNLQDFKQLSRTPQQIKEAQRTLLNLYQAYTKGVTFVFEEVENKKDTAAAGNLTDIPQNAIEKIFEIYSSLLVTTLTSLEKSAYDMYAKYNHDVSISSSSQFNEILQEKLAQHLLRISMLLDNLSHLASINLKGQVDRDKCFKPISSQSLEGLTEKEIRCEELRVSIKLEEKNISDLEFMIKQGTPSPSQKEVKKLADQLRKFKDKEEENKKNRVAEPFSIHTSSLGNPSRQVTQTGFSTSPSPYTTSWSLGGISNNTTTTTHSAPQPAQTISFGNLSVSPPLPNTQSLPQTAITTEGNSAAGRVAPALPIQQKAVQFMDGSSSSSSSLLEKTNPLPSRATPSTLNQQSLAPTPPPPPKLGSGNNNNTTTTTTSSTSQPVPFTSQTGQHLPQSATIKGMSKENEALYLSSTTPQVSEGHYPDLLSELSSMIENKDRGAGAAIKGIVLRQTPSSTILSPLSAETSQDKKEEEVD